MRLFKNFILRGQNGPFGAYYLSIRAFKKNKEMKLFLEFNSKKYKFCSMN